MVRRWRSLGLATVVLLVLTAGVLARGWKLVRGVERTKLAAVDRPALLERLTTRGDELPGAASFCFGDDVPVVLGNGPDGEPGQAEFDDNLDGVIDDRGEIGAVGSDDVCLAPADRGYAAALRDPQSFIISSGAFLPCDDAAEADRFLVDGIGWVIVADRSAVVRPHTPKGSVGHAPRATRRVPSGGA
jgi:hypothetical protein